MSITYTYEVVSVDAAARCMEIMYAADGHQTMHIGARLPYEGETLEEVVQMFAPVPLWLDLAKPVVVVPVGARGTVDTAYRPEGPTPPASGIPQAVL